MLTGRRTDDTVGVRRSGEPTPVLLEPPGVALVSLFGNLKEPVLVARRRRRGLLVVLTVASLLAVTLPVGAEDAFDVAVGLGESIVPGRFAPIRLTPTSDLADATHLRVVQDVGNAWRGETTMSFEVPIALSDAGDCEEVIPIYDAALPLRVELLAAGGRVLAQNEVDLRSRKADQPFAVGVGVFSVPFADRLVSISPADLPRDGAAYSAAASVWIGRTRGGLDADQWDALARWVISGGTLVVFTGDDFYLLDAPRLRDLLPVVDPIVTEREDGLRILAGDLRTGASVLLSEAGAPLLISGSYGGGTILLVSTDAFSLDRESLANIQSQVPPAHFLSLNELASTLLDRQPVAHPSAWAAFLLLVLAVIALPALVLWRERKSSTVPALLGAFCFLTLLSWVYTAPSRAVRELYQTNVTLSLYSSRSSLGVSALCVALFSASRQPAAVDAKMDAAPLESLPSRFEPGSFDLAYREGTARIELMPGERRVLAAQESVPARLQAWLAGDEGIRVKSRLPHRISDALLLIDGVGFLIPAIEPRETTIYLGSTLSPDAVHLGAEGGPLDLFLAAAARTLPLDRGAWLIAGEVTETQRRDDGAWAGVRDVSLYVAEVERD